MADWKHASLVITELFMGRYCSLTNGYSGSAEIYPNDRPKIEDVLKEIAFGIYRKPRFLQSVNFNIWLMYDSLLKMNWKLKDLITNGPFSCDALKNALPKSMTKFGPASAILDWIDKKDGKKMTMYKVRI